MSQAAPWTDQSIVIALAGGGAERDRALQWWFGNEGLQRWVRHYATEHGGSEADGEDLYHDAFITFDRLLREGKYRAEATLKTFFCSIAKIAMAQPTKKTGKNRGNGRRRAGCNGAIYGRRNVQPGATGRVPTDVQRARRQMQAASWPLPIELLHERNRHRNGLCLRPGSDEPMF